MQKPTDARWNVGSTFGRLIVIAEPWREKRRRASGRTPQWVYSVRCSCGIEEKVTQEAIAGGRDCCKQCKKAASKTKTFGETIRPTQLPDDVPDFARLPVPESIRRK